VEIPHPDYSNIVITVTLPPIRSAPTMQSGMAADAERRRQLANLWAFDPYARYVKEIISLISRSPTGSVILGAIQGTGLRMVIRPFTPTAADPVNAYASPDSWENATPNNHSALQCGGPSTGQPIQEGWIWRTDIIGNGNGSNVHVDFTPGMWRTPPALGGSPGTTSTSGPGSQADEILLHEMLHGYRDMTGKLLCTSTGNDDYDTFEEYFAIVITNMYVSEVSGNPNAPLRSNHHSFSRLSYPDLFPDQAENRRRLQRIHGESLNLTERLALRGRGPFNPFRDLFLITTPDLPAPTTA
jgi:hypothetical protein